MNLKRCSKCKQYKDINQFHRNKYMADGRAGQCIPCFTETHKKYRESQKYKETQAAYAASEKGKRVRAKANKKWRASKAGKRSYAGYYRRHKRKNRA